MSYSQSDLPLYDYLTNPTTYNPAYTGITDSYYFKLSHSTQWLGIDGASHTEILDFQKMFRNDKNAIGISIVNDEFGAVRNLNFELNYAFHTKLNYQTDLVLGLKAGYNKLGVDYNLLNIFDPTEAIYLHNDVAEPLPIIGAGFYVSNDRFWFSASAPNLISIKIKSDDSVALFRKRSHKYFNFGYYFFINNQFDLRTQVLGQIVKGAPLSYIVDLGFEYEQKFLVGIHSNPSSFVGFNFGINVLENGRISYGYNFSLNDLSDYTNGNHYISFSYFLQKSRGSISNYRGYSKGNILSRKPYIMR